MKKTLLYTLSLFMLGACGSGDTDQAEKKVKTAEEDVVILTEAQFTNAGISYTKLGINPAPATLRVNGIIDVPPQNMVSVTNPLGGYLKSTHLLPGMHVNKGEVLAVMEDRQYVQLQQDYLEARSKLFYIENEYKRQQALNKDKASSDKQFNQVAMERDQWKIALSGLAEKCRLLGLNPDNIREDRINSTIQLRSPIDGFVSKVNVNIGKYVNPTDVMFELVSPDDIHLNLKIFENDFNKITMGQKVLAYTNTQPDKKYPCEVILISKDVLPDRSIEVHCHFEKYDKSLIPGMYMNADIELQGGTLMALPEDAVVNYQGLSYIFVTAGQRTFKMLPVEAGEPHHGMVDIADTTHIGGREIVHKGAYTLLMALKNKESEEE